MAETILEMSKRICRSVQDCRDCPIFCTAGPAGLNCLPIRFGKEIEVIDAQLNALRKWAEEHSTKPTYKDVFLEKFPKATILDGNTTLICKNNVFGASYDCLRMSSCEKCWNEPYKEETDE
jgi:hypothetical protein